jgi:DHA1 family tetracycline resistance protein-like MFS transporter
MDRRLFVIALILFVNALAVGLILPLLPFYGLSLGASPLAVGLLIATLPFFATLSGPPLGVLSDRFGRKPILLFSIGGTVVGFVILGFASTLPMVFLARIVDGISAGNTSTARAAIADLTSRQGRLAGIGITYAMESLGLILGPVLGGVFAPYGPTVAAFVAGVIALACLTLTAVAFTETRSGQQAASLEVPHPERRTGDLLAVLRVARTRVLVVVIFAVQLLITMMWGALALYANQLFGFTGQQMGYVSAFAASIGIMAQVGLLRLAFRSVAEPSILVAALSTMGAGLLLLALTGTVPVLLLGVGLMAASFNVAMPTAMGLVSRLSSPHEQGRVMGTMSSAVSLASVLGPVVAGALFSVSPRGSYLVASAAAVVVTAVCLRGIVRAGY